MPPDPGGEICIANHGRLVQELVPGFVLARDASKTRSDATSGVFKSGARGACHISTHTHTHVDQISVDSIRHLRCPF